MGHKRNNSTKSMQRDTSDIATDSEVLRTFIKKNTQIQPLRPFVTPQPPKPLSYLEDRRAFHPNKLDRPAMSVRRADATLRVSPPKPSALAKPSTHNLLPVQIGFKQPKGVAVCVRRKIRREVIFATRNTGKGSKARRHRNEWSDIKC